jgi:hypothetical protein
MVMLASPFARISRASKSCAINIESSLNNFCLPADSDFVFVRSTIVEF